MFLENSRYFNQPIMKRKLKDGRTAILVQSRLLPSPEGALTPLEAKDRLDTLALERFQDGTKFWHIADANTLLEARRLTEPPAVTADASLVPSIIVPGR